MSEIVSLLPLQGSKQYLAYHVFCDNNRDRVQLENPLDVKRQIKMKLEDEWKMLPDDEKEKYETFLDLKNLTGVTYESLTDFRNKNRLRVQYYNPNYTKEQIRIRLDAEWHYLPVNLSRSISRFMAKNAIYYYFCVKNGILYEPNIRSKLVKALREKFLKDKEAILKS